MVFNEGDKVKFLNDVGGGVVVRVENHTVYVQNEDGFEIPVLSSQLLKVAVSREESNPFNTTVQTAWKQPASQIADRTDPQFQAPAPLEYIDLSDEPEDANPDPTINVLSAWVANRKKNGDTAYDVYLINDCSYHIMYAVSMLTGGIFRGIQAGMLEKDSTIHLTEISGKELKDITSLHFDLLFFKKGGFMPQEPINYRLGIDEFYLMDAVNYQTNVYFDEKALIYNITEEYLLSEIENAARKGASKLEQQKKRMDERKPLRIAKKEPESPEEIDLHIEQLVDDFKRLSPAEMLDLQMSRFHIALDGAIRNRQKRIVFIHGVGNGRLRLEVCKSLDKDYPKLRYQDASFKEYGYGATLVFL